MMELLQPGSELLPFSQFPFLSSNLSENIQSKLNEYIASRKIEFFQDGSQADSFMTRLEFPSSQLLGVQFGPRTHIISRRLSSHHLLMPLEGEMTIRSIGDGVKIRPGQAALHLANEALFVDWHPDSKAIVIVINPFEKLPHIGSHHKENASRLLTDEHRYIIDLTHGAGASLANIVNTIRLEAENNTTLLKKGRALHLFEQLLIEAVRGLYQSSSESEFPPSKNCRPARLKKALEVIHASLKNEISLEELTQAAGCSARTLQHLFAEHMGMGPMTYVKQIRLDRVRQDLLNASPETTTVSEIAARWGFFHASNFTANYSRLFGEKPSQTLRLTLN